MRCKIHMKLSEAQQAFFAARRPRKDSPHTTDGTLAPEEVDFLTARGVESRRIAVSHMDTNPSPDYHFAVARRGQGYTN